MNTRTEKVPGPDHPITIEESRDRFVVRTNGQVVAESTKTLSLREASYPPVQYFPMADVDLTLLRPSGTSTYCPYKGDASYYSIAGNNDIPGNNDLIEDAIWTYIDPFPAVKEIAGYLAFYPDRVEITSESAS